MNQQVPSRNTQKEVSFMCLNDLNPGQTGVVRALRSTGGMRRRLLDIGLIPDTTVACLGRSPGGDPSAYLIRGAVIAIRTADSRDVLLHSPSTTTCLWD